jgi:hypothetical protein
MYFCISGFAVLKVIKAVGGYLRANGLFEAKNDYFNTVP